MARITSAGAASGIDLESIISTSVAAKKAQLEQPLIKKETFAKVSLSGVGQLKSAIAAYVTTLKGMTKSDAFNKRMISVTQDKDNPVLKVESKTGTSNGQYNITVNKLATTSKFAAVFNTATDPLVTQDGTLTFSAGTKTFSVDVKAGDNLENIRKRINNDGDNFGLSANVIKTSDGKVKLIMDSGISGDGKDMTISGSTGELSSFASSLTLGKTQSAGSAEIDVDGNKLTSDTNTFDDTIMGLKITVLRISDKDTSNNLKPNKVDISTDKDGIKTILKSFIDGYNALVSKSNELGKRNTVVSGVQKDDGGALAGDSMPRTVVNLMSSTITEKSSASSDLSTIFQMGVKMDKDGVLSLDDTKFNDALSKNYEQVVALFSGDEGLANKLAGQLDVYSKSGGLLSKREDGLNSQLREVSRKKADTTTQMAKYEEALRIRYGSLDTLLAKLNKSASYLNMLNTK
ncbi:flagellar filament capping protein FliD [Aeromonas allosaccharophila]|uniref:flagellar filament capping protein FliD n=1 Tax=Aeromonas allosaccharophila TaxID=656 RepID=UPI003004F3CF